jgi:hypothetical protein
VALRAFLLLFALLATGLVAWLLLSESGPSSRSERRRGAEAPEQALPAAPDAERAPGAATKAPPAASRAFPLLGYVRDTGGAPIPGAAVRAAFSGKFVTDLTDKNGAYAIEVATPICTFDVWAPGYLPLVGTVDGRSNGELDFVFDGDGPWRKDFTLKPAASLEGHVYDDTGQPVRGARVYVIPADYALLDRQTVANVVTSDATGAFSLPGLPAGVTDVGARATGFLPALVKDVAIAERGTAQQDLRLERGREVKVTVLNDAARVELPGEEFVTAQPTRVIAADSRLKSMLLPPGGADVLADGLVGRAFAGLPVLWATYGPDSKYELRGVGPGPADVAARLGPGSPAIIEPGLGEKLDTTESEVTLTLVPGILIYVNVRDAVTGNPLDPTVTRRTSGVDGELPVDAASSASRSWKGHPPDQNSLKNLLRVPADDRRHTLVFRLDGYQDARLDLPDLSGLTGGPEPTFDVAMSPAATGETGSFYVVFDPPLNGRIALIGRDSTGMQRWVKHIEAADKEGKWAVEDVPVGEYAVSVLATGMVPAFLPRVVIARELKDTYRITLTQGGGLSLKVTDAAGQLLDQVHLLLKDQAGNQIDVHVLSQVSEGSAFLSINYLPSAATAKADSGLAPGSYEIAVYREGYEVGRKSFQVQGTDVADVEIALQKATK